MLTMNEPLGVHSPTEVVLHPARKLTRPNPEITKLGVLPSEDGLRISVWAPNASAVDFCVIDRDGQQIWENRYGLRGPVEGIWHGLLPGHSAGTVYGFRVHGKWDPDAGSYHNPNKLLLDPYGRGIVDDRTLSALVHAHQVDSDLYPTTYPLLGSTLNSVQHSPKSVVTSNHFQVDPSPKIPWNETAIYEVHVKGFTKNLPGVPSDLQGTYAGLAHPASIDHLKNLGITAIELLPVMAKMDEPFLTERGLTNYWGYSTLSFFSPEPTYATMAAQASGAQAVVDEFRGMVSLLHKAGIEVIMDVVFNHTCEGGDAGPTVCWRGLDSTRYYRLTDGRPRRCIDDTGCGNTVNFSEPKVVQMALDSLRYWTSEMGVDGFRFDLAVTLGRLWDGYKAFHPFFVGIAQDPILKDAKMIAEPWDIGPGGWQTGNFPIPFSEWNDRYRDSVRSFWLSDFSDIIAGRGVRGAGDLATRLSGSADLFSKERGVRASVNFVAAHDGFTLADLTSYDHKHNLANLENNQDGTDNNHSWNHGIEGEPGDNESDLSDPTGLVEDVMFARERSRRNIMATLLVSAGTPMILGGDEFSRTQMGNNNAYCQDSPVAWMNWDLKKHQERQLETTKYLLGLRRLHPVMRPSNFATGALVGDDSLPDVSWIDREGAPIQGDEWSKPSSRLFQMRRSGVPADDADLLVVFNGELEVGNIKLADSHGSPWILVFDSSWMHPKSGRISAAENALDEGRKHKPSRVTQIEPQSLQIYMSAPRLDTDGRMSG